MKLVVFAIGGLSLEFLAHTKFAAMSGFTVTPIASTIPCQPKVAWQSAWTGMNPSKHGVLHSSMDGVDKTFWDELAEKGFTVSKPDLTALGLERDKKVSYLKELERKHEQATTVLNDDPDIAVLPYNEFHLAIHELEFGDKYVEKMAAILSKTLDLFADIPMVIVSAYGMQRFPYCLNVDLFLLWRKMLTSDANDNKAYPVCHKAASKDQQEFGIHLNHDMLTRREILTLRGELTAQLNQVSDIDAFPPEQYYDPAGDCDTPDILITSPKNQTFIRNSYVSGKQYEAYGKIDHSSRGIFARNFPIEPFTLKINLVDYLYSFVCRFLGIEVRKEITLDTIEQVEEAAGG